MLGTPLGRVATVLAVWAAAAALLYWPRLSGPWRRTLALTTSGAGLVFLVLALSSQGLRESASTAVFLMGRPYVTEQVSATASLPYYVATALCLLLGIYHNKFHLLRYGKDLIETARQISTCRNR